MVPLRRQILLNALKLFDPLVMVFSFTLATVVVYYQFDTTSFEDFLSMRIQVRNFGLFVGFLIVWHIIFSVFRLYYSRRLSTRWEEVIDVIKATSAGSVVIFIASTLFRISLATPVFILVFWMGSSGITILGRLMLRQILKWLRLRGRNLRFMLIVGTNERAVNFSRKIASSALVLWK